jgi:hypothetical protein
MPCRLCEMTHFWLPGGSRSCRPSLKDDPAVRVPALGRILRTESPHRAVVRGIKNDAFTSCLAFAAA